MGYLLYFLIIYAISTVSLSKIEPIVLVHGGAGRLVNSLVPHKREGVIKACQVGYKVLQSGGSAIDAVVEAVMSMENDPVFNSGKGSYLNFEGEVEMDASIMEGTKLRAGAVAVVKDVSNPIQLARLVMDKTPHVLLCAHGANKFAAEQGIKILPKGSLITAHSKELLQHFLKHHDKNSTLRFDVDDVISELGTVGAVAIDSNGRVAAASSSGGMTGKMVGRTATSALLGSGIYADDDVGAVTTTGHGEAITRVNLAYSIINEMKNGKTAKQATKDAIEYMTKKVSHFAGAVTISKTGEVGYYFNSKRMAWAYRKKNVISYGTDEHDLGERPTES